MGGQFYDYQNYHDIPYLHGGLDLCAPAGTQVYAPVSGQISISSYKIDASARPPRFEYNRKPFKPSARDDIRYTELAIRCDAGNTWMLRHINPTNIAPQLLKSNARVEKGELIGTVVRWNAPVLPEKRSYDHIHLEIVNSQNHYLNPANHVRTARDYYPPVIHAVYATELTSYNGIELGRSKAIIRGPVNFVVYVNDRMNGSSYQHSVYKAGWSLEQIMPNGQAQTVVEFTYSFIFDILPITGDRTQLANTIYKDKLRINGKWVKSNGNHGPRTFLLNLTAGNVKTGYHPNNHFDSTKYPNGNYRLNIEVADMAGNRRQKTVPLTINNH